MGPVTALAGACLQDVERGAHEGGKRPLASRLRRVSSKAMHPPTYLPLHTADGETSVNSFLHASTVNLSPAAWELKSQRS